MRYLFLLNRAADEELPELGTPEAAAMFGAGRRPTRRWPRPAC